MATVESAYRTARRAALGLVLLGALAGIESCRSGPREAGSPALVSRVSALLDRPELRGSTAGVKIVRHRDGRVLCAVGEDRLLPSASTAKLASSAGALLALGPDYRFVTPVVAAGSLEDGILDGDLVLVASGDPNLSQRVTPDGRLLHRDKDHSYAGFYRAELVEGDPLVVLRDLARRVWLRGVREVRGNVVVDDGLFRAWVDPFVGPVSASCVNDNLVDVVARPGPEPGAPLEIEVLPRSPAIRVRSEAATAEAGTPALLWLTPEEPDPARDGDAAAAFVLHGSLPAGSHPVLRVASFRDPALTAAALLLEELRSAGVRIAGGPRRATRGPSAYREAPVIAEHASPPLREALRVILKVSHNLHATMLLPLLGALEGRAGTVDEGFRVMRERFRAAGIETDDVSLHSGAGGDRADRVSASWVVDLLRALARRDDFRVFLDALPIGGQDGTLQGAFRDRSFAAAVHAKTGTLVYPSALNDRWVYVSKALAGYVDLGGAGDPDDLVVFSIIVANTLVEDRAKGARLLVRLQEDLLEAALESVGALP